MSLIDMGYRLSDEQEAQYRQIRAQELGIVRSEGARIPLRRCRMVRLSLRYGVFDKWLTCSVKAPASSECPFSLHHLLSWAIRSMDFI